MMFLFLPTYPLVNAKKRKKLDFNGTFSLQDDTLRITLFAS
jgi:hypothetical protein